MKTNDKNQREFLLEMPGSNKKYVRDCITGNLIEISRARRIGWSKGKLYYIDLKRSILEAPREKLIPTL